MKFRHFVNAHTHDPFLVPQNAVPGRLHYQIALYTSNQVPVLRAITTSTWIKTRGCLGRLTRLGRRRRRGWCAPMNDCSTLRMAHKKRRAECNRHGAAEESMEAWYTDDGILTGRKNAGDAQ